MIGFSVGCLMFVDSSNEVAQTLGFSGLVALTSLNVTSSYDSSSICFEFFSNLDQVLFFMKPQEWRALHPAL